jgi:MFS family permease
MAEDDVDLDAEKLAQNSLHVEQARDANVLLSEEDAAFLEGFSEERRKRVIRKVDIRLVPFLAVLYLMAFLDRANIGNAKIEGMLKTLNMTEIQYNIVLSIFFVPYILFEIPSNQILVLVKRPSWYIGGIAVAWGTVMTLTGIVQNFGGLIAARIALGIAEAGFFPGAIFTISRWYLPNETQFRVALFYTSSALSGAFSGLLAYAIAKMDGVAGLEGWRWIFIIEGIASVAIGALCFNFLLDTPSLSGKWLEPDEARYLELRQIAHHGVTTAIKEAEKQRKWKILKSVFKDWHLYLCCLVYWASVAPNYGLKFTMPEIMRGMGYTTSTAQLMTVPPYVIGAISSLVAGIYSDKLHWRMPFVVAPILVIIVAYAILFAKAADIKSNIGLCYFAVCLACAGLYPISPGINTWTVTNLAGPTKKAQGAAYMIALGNIGGIIGSYMFIDREAPRYPTGYGLSLGFGVAGIAAAFLLEWGLWAANKRKAAIPEAEIRGKYNAEELALMGDRSPLFKYHL